MAAHFCPITRDEIHEFLSDLGFVPLNLKGVVELVYAKIVWVGGHQLSLRCYTAVNSNGESREKGTDAIAQERTPLLPPDTEEPVPCD